MSNVDGVYFEQKFLNDKKIRKLNKHFRLGNVNQIAVGLAAKSRI